MAEPTAHSGAATVTRNLIRLLESPPIGARVECLAPPAPASRLTHRVRQAASIARSFTGPLPAKAAFTCPPRFHTHVRQRLERRDFDLVAINGADLLWALPNNAPAILIEHNIEHALAGTQTEMVGRKYPILRPLLRREQERMQRLETHGITAARGVVFLSPADARRAAPRARSSIVIPPVFFDPPTVRNSSRDSEFVEAGFLANQYWWPNREGLEWFLKEVFPTVRRRARLHVFGPGTDSITGPNVIGHGPVPNLGEVWTRCDLMICPILHGSGVSIKVAEALYNGVPVLATSHAARGLELPPDPSIHILDGAETWARFLVSPQAGALRGQRVSPAVSALFAPDRQVAGLHRFLTGVLTGDSP